MCVVGEVGREFAGEAEGWGLGWQHGRHCPGSRIIGGRACQLPVQGRELSPPSPPSHCVLLTPASSSPLPS